MINKYVLGLKVPFKAHKLTKIINYDFSTTTTQINDINSKFPFVTLKKKIPFDKNGLYLVAEYKKEYGLIDFKIQFLDFYKLIFAGLLYHSFLLYEFLLIFMPIILSRINRLAHGEQFIFQKIYLCDDMNGVIFTTLNSNKAYYIEIKNYSILIGKDDDIVVTNDIFSVKLYQKYIKIPLNISIYDEEVFSAICHGYNIKIEDVQDEDKDINKRDKQSYIKLLTKDYKSYYV
jgi:hypothetical protein